MGRWPAVKLVLSGMKTGDRDAPQVLVKMNMKPTPCPSIDALVMVSNAEIRDAWRSSQGIIPESLVVPQLASRELSVTFPAPKRRRDALQSSIQILAEHPHADSFPMASFDVLELGHVPVGQSDIYVACCFKVAEVGPVSGEGERFRRQVRVVGTEEGSTESWTVVLFDSHAESDLLQRDRLLVLAGALVSSSPRTLLGYANLSCLMEYRVDDEE